MIFLYLFLAAAFICGLIVAISYACYRMAFFSKPRIPLKDGEYDLPTGKGYDELRGQMTEWVDKKRALPHEELTAVSFDGLTLHGKFYEYAPDAPVELLFHGYRGSAERDLSGAIERCFSIGRSALIIDQRGAGESEGSVITFGINECRDCLVWIDRALERFGSDVTLILAGVSMGGATVAMASAEKLPKNVKYVIADCSYTTPREIISKVIAEMGIPPKLAFPFIRLGGLLFGRFDIDGNSPLKAVRSSNVPVFFIHGDADDFVPCNMSERLFSECTAPKKFVAVKDAVHGLAFPADKELYIRSLKEFEKENKIFDK